MSVQPPHGFPDPNQGPRTPQGPHGHGPVPPGYPQQPPQGGFPPPAGPGYPGGPGFPAGPGHPAGPGLPGGPQGPFPPGGPHPRGGYPGAPAPRPRRTGMIVGGAVAGAVVLLAGVGAAVVLNAPREYASFPDCDEVFDAVAFENAAEITGLSVDGEFEEGGDGDRGSLRCEIAPDSDDDSSAAFSVFAEVLEPGGEDWEEGVDEIEKILTEAPDELSQGDRGPLTIDGETSQDAVWRTSSAGDTGIVVGFVEDADLFSFAMASNIFIADNLEVSVTYAFEAGDLELEDAVDLVRSLGGDVETALRRAGETA
ncbi:hypothetical protein SAMN05421803_10788 [Nocardiopsis flavescens]|uniref:Uncharacterized protein n=2 Tax=Nocardiopsis flavescens TaxID=758803 RepID=A0A1M6K9G2_9ACTN|nr:hypothetical protein SAMN05421803_10788 [Nocardiopsis flavescens]